MNRAIRLALLLGLAPMAGCVVEREARHESVAWARYDQDHATWQTEHDRWERQKAARDRKVQQNLQRQWPKPTAAAPDDPLAPEALDEPREAARPAALRPVVDRDRTPPPPNHYVPEDERVVVERASSVDVDVGIGVGVGVGVGYVGYGSYYGGTYVGPRAYRRPRYVGSYTPGYCPPPRRVDSSRCAPVYVAPRRCAPVYVAPRRCAPVYVAPRRSNVLFVAPRAPCAPVDSPRACAPRAPASCPPAVVTFAPRHHRHGGRRSHDSGVQSFSHRPSFDPSAPAGPAPPSWAVKN